ncbi:hypothetical protein Lalb_Chr22g0357721 [Lupinus albus]|uniref:Uncharacterized protein n=1 Tax=Lupinus albus TaxID=3870 RepID=A0A6A4NGS7_LUPAL|nr:hypothetical protein Lalb_Chr22g0357721 [Lupinus albus]
MNDVMTKYKTHILLISRYYTLNLFGNKILHFHIPALWTIIIILLSTIRYHHLFFYG